MKFAVISAIIFYVVGAEAQCWWSGCQPKTWAQRGCFPATNWRQDKSESCPGGDKYYCCPQGGGGGNGGGGSGPILGGGGASGPAEEIGQCSWYGADNEIPPGSHTANGDIFDRNAYTAAHKTLPFGTRIRVKNLKNNKTVDVAINDRGPFTPGRIVDLTYAAFGSIDSRDVGVVPCSYVRI